MIQPGLNLKLCKSSIIKGSESGEDGVGRGAKLIYNHRFTKNHTVQPHEKSAGQTCHVAQHTVTASAQAVRSTADEVAKWFFTRTQIPQELNISHQGSAQSAFLLESGGQNSTRMKFIPDNAHIAGFNRSGIVSTHNGFHHFLGEGSMDDWGFKLKQTTKGKR